VILLYNELQQVKISGCLQRRTAICQIVVVLPLEMVVSDNGMTFNLYPCLNGLFLYPVLHPSLGSSCAPTPEQLSAGRKSSLHGADEEWSCPSCSKVFRKEALLDCHVKYYHNAEEGGMGQPGQGRKRRKTVSVCKSLPLIKIFDCPPGKFAWKSACPTARFGCPGQADSP
jgi:hypothetical protein